MEFGDLHHGFRGNRISDPLKKKQASIFCTKWTCPPKFTLNDSWHVAAGEQSEEIRIQNQRETRVTGVIYPLPSAIPTSSSISLDVEEGHLDDGHNTPIIPLTPIEDDAMDSSSEAEPPSSMKESLNLEVLHQGVSVSHMENASQVDASAAALKPRSGGKHPLEILTGLEADVGAAASAAFTALMKSYEQGSLIDTDLLIKILSDPKMIELLKDAGSFGNVKTTFQHGPEVAAPSPSLTNPTLENSDTIQPSLNTLSVLHLNNHFSSSLRNPLKEGSNKLPTTMHLTSKTLGMLVPDTAIPSVPLSCPALDTMLKHVFEESDTLLKRVHPAPDLLNFISSVDMAIPKSEQPLQHKLENLVHDSFPVSKPPTLSVAMLTRVPVTSLPQKPRDGVTTSAPPRPSFLSTATSLSFSADKSSFSVKAPLPVKDASYFKSLVRQHGVERQKVEGQQCNHKQFSSGPNIVEPGTLLTHLQRQGHGKLKVSSRKPCICFSSPKGCRRGLNCPHQHDLSTPQLRAGTVLEAPSGKRVKLNREIYGRFSNR